MLRKSQRETAMKSKTAGLLLMLALLSPLGGCEVGGEEDDDEGGEGGEGGEQGSKIEEVRVVQKTNFEQNS